jgi:hypothetical protein
MWPHDLHAVQHREWLVETEPGRVVGQVNPCFWWEERRSGSSGTGQVEQVEGVRQAVRGRTGAGARQRSTNALAGRSSHEREHESNIARTAGWRTGRH